MRGWRPGWRSPWRYRPAPSAPGRRRCRHAGTGARRTPCAGSLPAASRQARRAAGRIRYCRPIDRDPAPGPFLGHEVLCLASRSVRWYVDGKSTERSMKVFRIAAVMALLTAPAYAQTPNINLIPELQSKSPEEKEQEAAQQKAYKESLKKIPDAKTSSDPWGNVRSVDTPKASAPAKPRTKTGSTAN